MKLVTLLVFLTAFVSGAKPEKDRIICHIPNGRWGDVRGVILVLTDNQANNHLGSHAGDYEMAAIPPTGPVGYCPLTPAGW